MVFKGSVDVEFKVAIVSIQPFSEHFSYSEALLLYMCSNKTVSRFIIIIPWGMLEIKFLVFVSS